MYGSALVAPSYPDTWIVRSSPGSPSRMLVLTTSVVVPRLMEVFFSGVFLRGTSSSVSGTSTLPVGSSPSSSTGVFFSGVFFSGVLRRGALTVSADSGP